ncbi:MAG TPA: SURF1 family protein [Noviherbaspirillum sp.]|jgi:cytochrome oxidase assembly protein ShyY1|uniref:SURF1 family protein n=1 Tax=Noviherbaspirillum sp. TaxID=1926288 RepID=UPI002DDCA43D|nr:SURF1 family protein [Noviherbaspirillum sp.]HEV2609921.1 SURF1 family protein [Noviherbaspirillum sp.]
MPIKFRFRWIPFIATIIAVAVGISLGQWQTRRAAEKLAIERKLSTREAATPMVLSTGRPSIDEVEYRRVRVSGQFVQDWPVYLDNRPHQGAAGFHLLMPFRIAGSDMHLLVARGWVKRDTADRTRLPEIATPKGTIELEGIARRNAGQVLQLGQPEPLKPGAIVQNLDIAELERATKLPMQAFVLEQTSDTGDGLVRDWLRPSTGVDKHRGYAFQWYALAATAFLFYVVTGLRRGKH